MPTRNINVTRYDDEYALFGKALPYIAMAIGAGLAFLIAFITRLAIYAQLVWGSTPVEKSSWMITVFIVISMLILSTLAWKLFRPRDQFHHHVAAHAATTSALIHIWLIIAVWQDAGDWMFGVPTLYIYGWGAIVIALSWCIRRWSFRGEDFSEKKIDSNPFAAIGLGDNTYVQKEKSYRTSNGSVYRLK